MGNINILDDFTIDKIAAGEVIERPASVIKELVENSIDSKASAITVEIKDGGISFLRVTDNGCGIEPDDVPVAFMRHATSKIKDSADLLRLSSLGFRGEALSSIAAVSQVELITKTATNMTGVRYMIAGGKEQSIEHIGCPEGTTFIMRNLFYNTPARQKFLKTPQTEGSHIHELIMQLALSHPEISFQYIANNKKVFHTSGNNNLKDIIYSVFGKDVAKSVLPIEFSNGDLKLTAKGFIGKPIVSRGNRSYENYYINQRYVKSPVIYKAVEDAYKTFTMIHRFPFICIAFDIAPEAIDVNVHPNKMELKFDNDRLMYDVIKSEIRSVLLKQDLIPEVAVDKSRKPAYESNKKGPQPFEINRRVMEEKADYKPVEPKPTISKPSESRPTELKTSELKPLPFVNKTIEDTPEVKQENASSPVKVVEPKAEIKPIPVKNEDTKVESKPIPIKNEEPKVNAKPVPVEVKDVKPDANVDSEPVTKNVQQTFYETPLLKEEAKPYHKVIGQLFRTYWLIEYDNKLFIMDQHAAHEKVNYERFMKRYKAHEGRYTQVVNPPIIVSLTPKEIDGYERFKDYFYDMGFDIEHFGGDEYSIHGVPTDMFGIADKEAFITLIDEVCEDIKDHDSDTIIINIATKACKASIKGGQKISYEEVDSLINQLMECDSPFTCPHGRPTLISMTKNEIEKKFKRIQDKEEGRLF